MQDVLSEINKLYETLKVKDKKLQDLISTTHEQLAILNKVKADQDVRDKSLEDREFKVSKIESIIALKNEANRLLIDAQELSAKTKKESDDFIAFVEKEKEGLRQIRVANDSCIKAVKEREEKLAEERKLLEDEKKHYKEWLIREMGK